MADTLVIVESPAKAKTIEKYLGPGYTVRASVGHVRDLPKSNKDAVDVAGGFVPKYRIIPEKKKVLDELSHQAKKVDEVILATDPDREGEAIAFHVAETLGLKKPKRIVFNEITQSAVTEALAHPRTIDSDLVAAQEARRVLDRLFGYDLSGLIWKKVRYGLSAGRVQSPALRIVMEREREIRAFVSHTYYALGVTLKPAQGSAFEAVCSIEPTDKKEAGRIHAAAQTKDWKVAQVEEKEQKRSPRPPFTTSTLQQVASTRLGFAPSRTMRAAQKLYEAGAISYMRTDSTHLSKEALANLLSVVEKEHGKNYLQPRVYKTKSKNAQEAHEAIRPTDSRKATAGKTDDERRLYSLIRTRALASQMADATVLRTKISTLPHIPTTIPVYVSNGSRVLFDGWLAQDTAARGEEVELPKVAVDDALTATHAIITEKHTEPPARYTEAGLIKELEKRGIGRPSTYAATMKTLADRGYVTKEGRTLIPTYTGDVVSTFVEAHFANYISDTFTAEMEDELDEIADGTRAYKKTLADFYTPFTKDIHQKASIPKLTNMGDAPKEYPCPECGSTMVYKL
jgi:DNA topoisomerase-1